jgi:DNA-binding GntR family transcriptional regulator
MRRYHVLSSRREPRRRAALEDHRALFEALRARDPEAAERTVRDHVLAACREGEAAADGLLSDRR